MAKTQEAKRDVSAFPARLKGAEFAHTNYDLCVDETVTREDLLKPTFWAHVAEKLRKNDEITVTRDDGAFYAKLLVIGRDKTWAVVKEIAFVDLRDKPVALPEDVGNDYDIKNRGEHKWCVIRKIDNAVIAQGHHTRKAAEEWLDVYLKNPTAAAA